MNNRVKVARAIAVVLVTALAMLGVVVAAGAESAPASSSKAESASAKPVILKRCGYTKAGYGRSAVYPWHMTCAQARRVIAASGDPHAAYVNLPGSDGGATAINGKFWVCTGQMGLYGCAYPWRPVAIHGQVEYTGPFTKGVMYVTCKVYGRGGCGATVPFTQPPS
jgi:hypothetical protein